MSCWKGGVDPKKNNPSTHISTKKEQERSRQIDFEISYKMSPVASFCAMSQSAFSFACCVLD